jgi:hypothetical protein
MDALSVCPCSKYNCSSNQTVMEYHQLASKKEEEGKCRVSERPPDTLYFTSFVCFLLSFQILEKRKKKKHEAIFFDTFCPLDLSSRVVNESLFSRKLRLERDKLSLNV